MKTAHKNFSMTKLNMTHLQRGESCSAYSTIDYINLLLLLIDLIWYFGILIIWYFDINLSEIRDIKLKLFVSTCWTVLQNCSENWFQDQSYLRLSRTSSIIWYSQPHPNSFSCAGGGSSYKISPSVQIHWNGWLPMSYTNFKIFLSSSIVNCASASFLQELHWKLLKR